MGAACLSQLERMLDTFVIRKSSVRTKEESDGSGQTEAIETVRVS
jgi:hypothetical protein